MTLLVVGIMLGFGLLPFLLIQPLAWWQARRLFDQINDLPQDAGIKTFVKKRIKISYRLMMLNNGGLTLSIAAMGVAFWSQLGYMEAIILVTAGGISGVMGILVAFSDQPDKGILSRLLELIMEKGTDDQLGWVAEIAIASDKISIHDMGATVLKRWASPHALTLLKQKTPNTELYLYSQNKQSGDDSYVLASEFEEWIHKFEPDQPENLLKIVEFSLYWTRVVGEIVPDEDYELEALLAPLSLHYPVAHFIRQQHFFLHRLENLWCKHCLRRPKSYPLGEHSLVRCPECNRSEDIKGVYGRITGQIGGKVPESQTGKHLVVDLWDKSMEKVRLAEVDEIVAHPDPNINWELALVALAEGYQNSYPRENLPIDLYLPDSIELGTNARRVLESIFTIKPVGEKTG